jgi:D-alanyl-lipoteichoic acid acyltransferase DltB (MBOAT superfamily)
MIILGYSVILDFFSFPIWFAKVQKKPQQTKSIAILLPLGVLFYTFADTSQMKTKLSVFSHFKL